MAKAERALASAWLLFDAGDFDGSCNRAYYAVFDAAKAALAAKQAPPEAIEARTHAGLISAFSLHIVKTGFVAVDHGRAFNRLHELRTIADYRDEGLGDAAIRQALAEADAFLAAVAKLLPEP
jgi:uncharacterized protein (UPF0332 family)